MAESLSRIKEIMEDMSPSERKVADFIFNNPKKISDLSIKELSEKAGASQAAVVRLCKRLHYKGYKDFRIMIAKDAVNIRDEEDMYTDIEPGDGISKIIKNVSYNNKKSIDNTLEFLSEESVEKAVAAIVKADKIVFYGVGASYIIALDAFQKFARINKNVITSSDTHMQAQFASNLKKGDVAVAISYSGETRDTYESIKIAKAAEATTIGITKFGQNSISNLCDIQLFVSAPEVTFRSGATSSRIAQLNVIDILYVSVASCMFQSIKKYLENTRRSISQKKIK
jgi:DNA-binding MurR/RpiR family transcriptional regulator